MPAPVFQGAQVILHSGAAIRGPLRCHYYCQELQKFTEVNLHQMIFFQTLYGSIANKLASLEATLVRNYDRPTYSQG